MKFSVILLLASSLVAVSCLPVAHDINAALAARNATIPSVEGPGSDVAQKYTQGYVNSQYPIKRDAIEELDKRNATTPSVEGPGSDVTQKYTQGYVNDQYPIKREAGPEPEASTPISHTFSYEG